MNFSTVPYLPPNISHVRGYKLDECSDAQEVAFKVTNIIHNEYSGSKLDINVLYQHAKSMLRTALQIQMEIRGLPIDLERIQELSKDITISNSNNYPGHVNVSYSESWIASVNDMFHIWTCTRCGMKIRDGRHSRDECHEFIVGSVIDE